MTRYSECSGHNPKLLSMQQTEKISLTDVNDEITEIVSSYHKMFQQGRMETLQVNRSINSLRKKSRKRREKPSGNFAKWKFC